MAHTLRHTHSPHTHTHTLLATPCTFAATFLACKPLCGLMWHFASTPRQRCPAHPLAAAPAPPRPLLPACLPSAYAAILLLVFHLTEANFGITTHFFTFASLPSKQIIIVIRERGGRGKRQSPCFMRKLNFQPPLPHCACRNATQRRRLMATHVNIC